jgi:hypothetical protein
MKYNLIKKIKELNSKRKKRDRKKRKKRKERKKEKNTFCLLFTFYLLFRIIFLLYSGHLLRM